ncbi:Carbonyl reductase [NADPH] 3 [Sparganum proliferum]
MKIAIVTGANRGVGLGIVETLARNLGSSPEWHVYLTARNEKLGRAAVDGLLNQGLSVYFHQLDIIDPQSRQRLRMYVQENYSEGIGILINNAGIAPAGPTLGDEARDTLATNYFATMAMCREFLPLMAKNSRLINLSSSIVVRGLKVMNDRLYGKFTSAIKLSELDELMQEYIKDSEFGDCREKGWPDSAYMVSKLGIAKGTFILAEDYKDDPRHILINACCPGFVNTDMTNHMANLTILEGADTPCYLALLPPDAKEPHGQMISHRKPMRWSR